MKLTEVKGPSRWYGGKTIKITAVVPNPDDATAWYRFIMPFRDLCKRGMNLQISMPTTMPYSNPVGLSDLIYMQRPCAPEHVTMLSVAKKMGVPVWVDYDDDLLEVPLDNPSYAFYDKRQTRDSILTCLKEADVVSISTPELFKLQRCIMKEEPRVISNALDFSLPAIKNRLIDTNRLNFFYWRGSETHFRDISTVRDAIVEFLKDEKSVGWKFAFHGFKPWNVIEHCPAGSIIFNTPKVPVHEFYEFLTYQAPKSFITPLHNNHFNRSKSNIGWIEAALSGAPTIVPDYLDEFDQPGAIRYSNDRDFLRMLRLVRDGEINTQELAEKAWDAVTNFYNLEHENHTRMDIITKLVGGE